MCADMGLAQALTISVLREEAKPDRRYLDPTEGALDALQASVVGHVS